MKVPFKLIVVSLCSLSLTACFFKKKESVAEAIAKQTKSLEAQSKALEERQAIVEAERKAEEAKREALAAREKEEQHQKERQQKLIDAPINQGEFKLHINPDPVSINNLFAVPVHVLTMPESQADAYRGMSSKDYWKNPSPHAKKITFGESGKKDTYTTNIPFKQGDNTVVVITKLVGNTQSISISNLKRNEDLSTPPLNLRLSSGGISPQ